MPPTTPVNIRRGQIWDVDFEPQIGAEIRKVRPAVVVSVAKVGRLPLRIVVPLTTGSSLRDAHWTVEVPADLENGLTRDSVADAFQIKSLSTERFLRLRGVLSAALLEELTSRIAYCIGYVTRPKVDD